MRSFSLFLSLPLLRQGVFQTKAAVTTVQVDADGSTGIVGSRSSSSATRQEAATSTSSSWYSNLLGSINAVRQSNSSHHLTTLLRDDSNDTVTSSSVESTYQVESPAVLDDNDAIADDSSDVDGATMALGGDLGVAQATDDAYGAQIVARIAAGRAYHREYYSANPANASSNAIDSSSTAIECRNQHANCAYWSVLGECENNPGYMHVHCPIVCQSCDQLQVETRCPLDPDAIDALARPGDVNRLFESILSNEDIVTRFQPTVLSRPTYAPGDDDSADGGVTAASAYTLGPWLVQFENLVSEDEAARMVELGRSRGYERSTDVGARRADGTYDATVSAGRTSTNAWCVDECYDDPASRAITRRMMDVTKIDEANYENLQLLRYETGQFYQTHNDFIPYQRERPTGVRILTFYVYLNDVEEGGGTNFPHLNLTVHPKRGRAVLWPSVLDEDPNTKDPRTDHQAQPVQRGVKYGANAWIHMRNFKEPNSRGC